MMMVSYTFPLQAQFQNPIKTTLKNALFIGLGHLGETVQLILLHMIPLVFCLALPDLFAQTLLLWLLCAPGGIAYFSTVRRKKIWAALLNLSQVQSETTPPEE